MKLGNLGSFRLKNRIVLSPFAIPRFIGLSLYFQKFPFNPAPSF